jgi:hypothetical protein
LYRGAPEEMHAAVPRVAEAGEWKKVNDELAQASAV